MTQEFRELTSLLAKGNNFPENAYLLGVLTDEGKELLIACDNTEARAIREAIISVIQEDEQRRFNDMEIKRYEGQNS